MAEHDFFKRGEADRSAAGRFFTTIVADLVIKLPDVAPNITLVATAKPIIMNKGIKNNLKRLIFQPIVRLPPGVRKGIPFVTIIDVLNE